MIKPKDIKRPVKWKNASMWAALHPKTGKILGSARTLGDSQEEGLTTIMKGKKYTPHYFPAIKNETED